jgi:hypothetical protein
MQTTPEPVGDDPDARLSPHDEIGSRLTLPNLYYSVRETRRLLGDISHATAYRLIAAGKLGARKIGGKTVISGKSIGNLAAGLPSVGRPA